MNLKTITDTEKQGLTKALYKVGFFESFSKLDFKQIVENFELREYEKDECIFKQGTSGDALYVIYKGDVKVIKKTLFFSEKEIAQLTNGDFFGEMALIKDIKRTASVFSTKTSLIFVLQSPSIDHLIQANPTFRNELTKLSNKRLGIKV